MQHIFKRLFAILDYPLFIFKSSSNCKSRLGSNEALILLLEGVVVHGDPIPQVALDLHEFAHEERRHLLWLHLVLAVLVDVDKGVSCLGRCCLASKRLLENDIFDLHGYVDITKAPPNILLAVIDEWVVVTTFSGSIVNQDSVQIVSNVVVIAECWFDKIFFLLDLLLDLCLLLFDGCLERWE